MHNRGTQVEFNMTKYEVIKKEIKEQHKKREKEKKRRKFLHLLTYFLTSYTIQFFDETKYAEKKLFRRLGGL